jgi:hypothetical protein
VRSPTKFPKTFTGSFHDIRLDFTPESPLTEDERADYSENYPTELAYLHVYLAGEDAAGLVPSAYLLLLLDHLLSNFADLTAGQAATARWFSDPWRFDLKGDPANNRVFITLHVPGRWVAMRDVSVPLDRFGQEVIKMAQKWASHLDNLYHDEIVDPKWGEQYRRFERLLEDAQKALRDYKSRGRMQ